MECQATSFPHPELAYGIADVCGLSAVGKLAAAVVSSREVSHPFVVAFDLAEASVLWIREVPTQRHAAGTFIAGDSVYVYTQGGGVFRYGPSSEEPEVLWGDRESAPWCTQACTRKDTVAIADRSRLLLWRLGSAEYRQIPAPDAPVHSDAISALAISPNEQLVASGDWHGNLALWHVQTGFLGTTKVAGKPVTAISFSPDGRLLGCSSWGGVTVFSYDDRFRRRGRLHKKARAFGAIWAPNREHLLTSTIEDNADDGLRLWELAGEVCARYEGSEGTIREIVHTGQTIVGLRSRRSPKWHQGFVLSWDAEPLLRPRPKDNEPLRRNGSVVRRRRKG